MPRLHAEGLVDAVDAFCEGIGFSPAQTRRVFETARALQLPVKLHADQLSDLGGGGLAAEFDGLSADHVEHTNLDSVRAMAAHGTVAVLLPGAFHVLRDTKLPPLDAFREHGVPMAVATDCNPGTSPLLSLRQAMQLACTHFRLTPVEALRGATVNGARALGLRTVAYCAPGCARTSYAGAFATPPSFAIGSGASSSMPSTWAVHVSSDPLNLGGTLMRRMPSPCSRCASPAALQRRRRRGAELATTRSSSTRTSMRRKTSSRQWNDLGISVPTSASSTIRARDGGLDVALMSIYTSPEEDDAARPGRSRTADRPGRGAGAARIRTSSRCCARRRTWTSCAPAARCCCRWAWRTARRSATTWQAQFFFDRGVRYITLAHGGTTASPIPRTGHGKWAA
jgi:hypothetical protein